MLAIGNDTQFAKFCEALAVPFATDPRFAKNADRVRNRDLLLPLIASELAQRSVREWVELLEPCGVPIGPINDLAQVFEHPQVIARGMKVAASHPLREELPLVASPMKLSATPPVPAAAPPMLGQHTSEVLREWLGLEARELEQLLAEGVIA